MNGRVDLSRFIKAGDTITWGQAHAEPQTLTRALVAQRHDLRGPAGSGRLRLLLGIDSCDTLSPQHADVFDFVSYCGTGANRKLAAAGMLDILPYAYSELSGHILSDALHIDVLLLQVSTPDPDGYHSLGLANDYLLAALDRARVVIAEVHPDVPWTQGGRIRAEELDLVIDADDLPLPDATSSPSATELRIAHRVASLIEDGSTLQMGLGGSAEATMALLTDRRDLGLHTGIAGDAVVTLMEAGAMTHALKRIDLGVGIACMLVGSQRLRRFAHRNPALQLRGCDYTHAGVILRELDRFVALNSAIEVDLTGQVNAEVAGGRYVGAVGGAPDFLRAAMTSRGGLPIVALPSLSGERSRVVARLSGPVSTPRCDAGLIVTEHGVADLRGRSVRERVRLMLDIADPSQREALERNAHDVLAQMA